MQVTSRGNPTPGLPQVQFLKASFESIRTSSPKSICDIKPNRRQRKRALVSAHPASVVDAMRALLLASAAKMPEFPARPRPVGPAQEGGAGTGGV